MTKKNTILILVIICFLTVMAISIWGKKPELSSRVPVTGMVIYDNEGNEITEINENSNRKEKLVTNERSSDYTEDNPFVYEFSVKVTPDDVTDASLNYEVIKGSEIVTVEQTTNGNIHSFKVTFSELSECNIKFSTNKTDTTQIDYLLFIWTGSEDGGNIEI